MCQTPDFTELRNSNVFQSGHFLSLESVFLLIYNQLEFQRFLCLNVQGHGGSYCGKLLMERWQESLSGFIPPLVGYGVPAQRLSFYRNVFGCFMLR